MSLLIAAMLACGACDSLWTLYQPDTTVAPATVGQFAHIEQDADGPYWHAPEMFAGPITMWGRLREPIAMCAVLHYPPERCPWTIVRCTAGHRWESVVQGICPYTPTIMKECVR